MNIITLDLGKRTGWCEGIKHPSNHGYVDICPKDKPFTDKHFFDFDQFIYPMLAHAWEVDNDTVVVVERSNQMMPSYHGVKIHFGMQGILASNCYMLNIPVIDVPAATLKKYWTGSGRANKPDMIKQTQKYYKTVEDDNESDAIALWVFAWDKLFNKGNK